MERLADGFQQGLGLSADEARGLAQQVADGIQGAIDENKENTESTSGGADSSGSDVLSSGSETTSGTPNVTPTGREPGGGKEVTGSWSALQEAGAECIHWDGRQYVGVIPPPGWDFSNPTKDKEPFVKWMMLAGHSEERAGKIWDQVQSANESRNAMVNAMTVAGLLQIAVGAAAAYGAARAAAAAAEAAGDSKLLAMWRSVANSLKGGDAGGATGGAGAESALPTVDLTAAEAAGGHTIEKHVGKTAEDLAARLAAQPSLPSASTFYDISTAESAVAETIASNQGRITSWLQGSQQQIRIQYDVGRDVGIAISRGTSVPETSSKVTVVLTRDPSSSEGYRIHTSYVNP